jgi:hypothetical protein
MSKKKKQKKKKKKKITHTKQQDTVILREDGLSLKYKYHAAIQNEIFLEVNFTL